jgi:mRNA-degrading endonuclease toxin of MazEF toxin-antitoxin module
MTNGLNKYLHGSVWSWVPGECALIISSDEYNISSKEVVCLAISSEKSSGSINIDDKKYVQCRQIHMIDKHSLSRYEGVISPTALAAIKTKIGALLNINLEPVMLQDIRNTAAALVSQITTMGTSYNPVVFSGEDNKNNASPVETNVFAAQDDMKPSLTLGSGSRKKTGKQKNKKPRYSDEDVAFIIDPATSTEAIMKKYGILTKEKVYSLRYSLKTRRHRPS